MISPDWVRLMARYNAWQNSGLRRDVQGLDERDATRDRGAFFGSILGTCNHLLWADTIWMSRFTGGPAPEGGIEGSPTFARDVADWAVRREAMDAAIVAWAAGVTETGGEVAWYSGALQRDARMQRAMVYTHFFNHQTHHRGQIHAMLTAAGLRPGDTDLFALPEMA